MTVCSECGAALETSEAVKNLPDQALRKECPSCGYSVDITIINYPSGRFQVFAPVVEGDVCTRKQPSDRRFQTEQCGDRAILRMQWDNRPVGGVCERHLDQNIWRALQLRDELP